MFFFFKQKTAYELRISDWSSDVCSSDLRMLRTTRLSSTSITRRVRAVGSLSGIRGCGWATERTSGDADELQFSFERFAVERLHHIFVGEIGRASCRERVCPYV